MSAAFDEDAEGVVAAVVAGLVLDVLLRVVAERRERPRTVPAIFGATAAVLWLGYFGLLALGGGIDWQPEIWLGAVALNALAAYAVAALAFGDD